MAVPSVAADLETSVRLGLLGDLYLNNGSQNNGQGYAQIQLKKPRENSLLRLDLETGGLVAKSSLSYFAVKEAYFQWGLDPEAFQVYFGRHLMSWSRADDDWQLGLTQPLFIFDGARPQIQGLTGLFVRLGAWGPVRLTLFGSPLYIPSQQPSFELEGGKISSANPWFLDPVEAISISGQTFDLNYQLQKPSTTDVVFQQSLGLHLDLNSEGRGYFSQLFYLEKPRNLLALPFTGVFNLTSFQGDVSVIPQVATHRMAGWDQGWQARDLVFGSLLVA